MRPTFKLLGATLAAIPIAAIAQSTQPPPAETMTQQPPATTTQAPPAETTTQPPATTTQPSTQATTQPTQTTTQQSTAVRAATTADIKADAKVYDQAGGEVGKVDSIDSEGVVVSTGSARVKIPLSSFGVGDKGLVIGTTKADLEAAAKKEMKDKPETKDEQK